MKKKILFIIFMIMICAGCNANYNLVINKDGSVEEKASLTESAEFFEQYSNSSTGRVISFILEPYLDTLNSKKYNIDNSINSNRSGVTISKKYDSIEEYAKDNAFYSQFTDKINVEKNGTKVTLSAKGAFSTSAQDQSRIPVEKVSISIQVPFKVTDNNADEVSGDTYIWNFDSEAEREIKLVYDSSKLTGAKSDFMLYIAIGVILGVLVILFLVYNNVMRKKQSVNKI